MCNWNTLSFSLLYCTMVCKALKNLFFRTVVKLYLSKIEKLKESVIPRKVDKQIRLKVQEIVFLNKIPSISILYTAFKKEWSLFRKIILFFVAVKCQLFNINRFTFFTSTTIDYWNFKTAQLQFHDYFVYIYWIVRCA